MAKEQGTEPTQELDFNLDSMLDNLEIDQEDEQETEESVGEEQKEETEQKESSEENLGVSEETEQGTEQEQEEVEDKSEIETEEKVSEDESSGEEKKETEEYGTDDTLRLYAEAFKEYGLLPRSFNLDEIEGNTLEEQISNQVNAMADAFDKDRENYRKDLDQLSKEVHDLVDQGIDYNEAKQRISDRARIEQVTEDQLEEDEQVQEYLLRSLYKKKNYSEKDIDKLVKRSRDAEALFEDSKEAKEELPKIFKQEDKQKAEYQRQQQEQREKRRQQTLEEVDNRLGEVKDKELFPGLKISDADVRRVKEYMTQPVDWEKGQDGRNIPISKAWQIKKEDPVGFEMKLNYLIHLGYFDKEADLNKIKKKQESNITSEIANRIKKQQKKEQKESGYSKTKGVDKDKKPKWKMPSGLETFK